MLQRTRIGKAMRAVADNRDLAASSGINVNRVILVVWVMGGALAALGGVLLGLSDQVQWDMGFRLLLLMFAGVTLGGLGTAYGALVGSLVVGVFVQMSTLVIPNDIKYVGGLLLLIVILVIRPQGILGSPSTGGLTHGRTARRIRRSPSRPGSGSRRSSSPAGHRPQRALRLHRPAELRPDRLRAARRLRHRDLGVASGG